MKLKNYILLCGFIVLNYAISSAQLVRTFKQTYTSPTGTGVRGNLVLVGNNIVNITTTLAPALDAAGEPTNLGALTAEANIPYNGPLNNNGQNSEYIDIDGDPTTFSSSRADLAINNTCKKIVYAGLYWTASYSVGRAERKDSNNNIITPAVPANLKYLEEIILIL
jgi:large repetitive protein